MNVTPHPEYTLLHARCRAFRALAKPFESHVVRCTQLPFARPEDLVSGVGSLLNGARFNASDSFPALYTALDAQTAVAEFFGTFGQYGLPAEAVPDNLKSPMILAHLNCRLQRVLDLRDRAVRNALEITPADLRRDWRRSHDIRKEEAFTQALGRAAQAAGFEGLLVPSQVLDGTNLVCFPLKLLKKSQLGIHDEAALLKHLKKWKGGK